MKSIVQIIAKLHHVKQIKYMFMKTKHYLYCLHTCARVLITCLQQRHLVIGTIGFTIALDYIIE